jgi:hypothetical protein
MRPYESSALLSSHTITPALHSPCQRASGLTADIVVNDIKSTGNFIETVSNFAVGVVINFIISTPSKQQSLSTIYVVLLRTNTCFGLTKPSSGIMMSTY